MLVANITEFNVPDSATEGNLSVSAEATGLGTLFFTWSLIEDNVFIQSVQQSSTSGNAVSTTLSLPDDNESGDHVYQVRLRVTDAAQTIDVEIATIEQVLNADPMIVSLSASNVVEGHATTLAGTYSDPGTADTHVLDIDWSGDGVADQFGVAISGGSFNILQGAAYLFRDDVAANPADEPTPQDTHNIKAWIRDDDGGSDDEFTPVTVLNDSPEFGLITYNATEEGGEVAVFARIVDDGVLDVWSVDVDWRDGSQDTIEDLGSMNKTGTVGETDYSWDAATRRLVLSHNYLDDDPSETVADQYDILLNVTDDDTGVGDLTVETFVQNAPPVLTLAGPIEISEGQPINLSGAGGAMFLGAFTDNGVLDTHSATVDWGDGSEPEVVDLNQGSGSGTLSATHFYADNDEDNLYTVTVTMVDDDGSEDVEFLQVTVLNVNPALQPITATDVENSGRTTLQLSFSDPGADTFRVMVDWGELLGLPPDERFVEAATFDGSTPISMTLEHFYAGPPDPLHPTADITIRVMIFDDDQLVAGVTANGVSNEEPATISNPGIAEHVAAIDTTPNVPRLEFAASGAAERFFVEQLAAARTQQSTQITSGGGELAATAERYLQLCMIRPDGRPEKCFRIKDESLFNLRGLFATLPDGRYQVFIIRTENNSRRLVIEVDVRRGQLVDAWDDSEGTRDRPPTSEAPAAGPAGGAVPLEQNPLLEPLPEQGRPNQAPADVDAACDCEGDPLVAPLQSAPTIVGPESGPGATGSVGLGLAGLGLAAGGAGGWSRRVDAALAAADRRDWERLRRAGRMGRVFAGP